MKTVVLAAGEGTRLRPLTDDRPEALVEVAGKPMLCHCLEKLVGLDADEVIIVVGYRAKQIKDRFRTTFDNVPFTYVMQDDRLGVAHALGKAREHIAESFMLMHGDYLFRQPLRPILTAHREGSAVGTLLVERLSREEPNGFGVCEFDENGDFVGLVEKPEHPPSNVVITGFSYFIQ